MKTLLRYKDLVEQGIVNNRMTLKRMIDERKFPAPIRFGRSIAWEADLIANWAASLRNSNNGVAA
ncbi:hypothetical protein CCC_04076 [Paramagnetospirillum magnetotacticum MS-1]|uniref:AlpA family phage regulatory protein n=1 Tax=Paramagnetospirillum magnetotacticum MS-1 TaxID=272627 RepID=A0A0C2YY15_PARME|nr:hypothetical protein [Paramagnetospirillum magnetotacticum]KIL99560.1 hypothetical protein CCC_04076 [Paramagnetospirillum magnetotacticum MS-1]